MKNVSLSTEQIEAINHVHMHAIDKLYRMHAGISSQLSSVKNGNALLEVEIHSGWKKTNEVTAKQFIESWTNNNPELLKIAGWEVKVYLSKNIAGFTISPNAIDSDELERKLEQFNTKSEKHLIYVWKSYIRKNGLPTFAIKDKEERFRLEYHSEIIINSCGHFNIERNTNYTIFNKNISKGMLLTPNQDHDYLVMSESENSEFLDMKLLSSSRLPVMVKFHGTVIYLVNLKEENTASILLNFYLKTSLKAEMIVESVNLS